MSDADLYCVAEGRRLAEAIPLFDRLTALAAPWSEMSVEVMVKAGPTPFRATGS